MAPKASLTLFALVITLAPGSVLAQGAPEQPAPEQPEQPAPEQPAPEQPEQPTTPAPSEPPPASATERESASEPAPPKAATAPALSEREVTPAPKPEPTPPEEEKEKEEDEASYRGGTPLPLQTGGALSDGYVEGELKEVDSAWSYVFGGYIRLNYQTVQNDPENQLAGRNDGFVIANVRPLVVGKYGKNFGFRIQMEGASNLPLQNSNRLDRDFAVRLRDAYIFYSPFFFAEFQAGLFRPPFDAESLFATARMLFPTRSVIANGRPLSEGPIVIGMGQPRQAGLHVTAARPWFPFASKPTKPQYLGISYAAALTNGNASQLSLNDNDLPAFYGRIALHWADFLRVGLSGFVNNQILGVPPDQVGSTDQGISADIAFDLESSAGTFTAVANYNQIARDPVDIDVETPLTLAGYQAQLGYREPFLGFQLAYRYATFDPSASFDDSASTNPGTVSSLERDALTYHSFGLNYSPYGLPFRLMLTYTLAMEQEDSELDNDRFDALLQVSW